jgi:transcriptional regulator with XRE-family HTH domain
MAKTSRPKTGIQRVREQHRLTQSEFADIAGVSPKTVQRWEQGTYIPRDYSLYRLCEHFNIMPEVLDVHNTDEDDEEEIAQQQPDHAAEDNPSKENTSFCLFLMLLGHLLLALILVVVVIRMA